MRLVGHQVVDGLNRAQLLRNDSSTGITRVQALNSRISVPLCALCGPIFTQDSGTTGSDIYETVTRAQGSTSIALRFSVFPVVATTPRWYPFPALVS